MSPNNEYTFTMNDKNNNSVQSRGLLVPESVVRMRMLYRWGLVLDNEKDIQSLSNLKEMNYVSTEYKNIFAQPSFVNQTNQEQKTTQKTDTDYEYSTTVDKEITSSNSNFKIPNNNKSVPLNFNDFLYNISFLPPIQNYKWVRRPVRNGYLYVYKKNKEDVIKLSEYNIHDGQLYLIAKDLIEENKKNKDANRRDVLEDSFDNNKFNPYWHSNTIDENDQLGEYGFAYSECRWSIQYIEHLIDDEKDRDERFQKIDIEEYYTIFKESISTSTNKFLSFQKEKRDLYNQFALADSAAYNFQSGLEYNSSEYLKFSPQIINKYIDDDVKVMTDLNSKSASTKPTMILNVTLIDHLGAIDDIVEDLTVSNALFNSLVETLGTPYSAYDKYEDNLKALIDGQPNEEQEDTNASAKMTMADEWDDILVDNENDVEEKDSSTLVQNKYTSSFVDAKKVAKMISYVSKVINANTTQIKEEDASNLHLSASLLYKILYSPESQKAANSKELREICTEQSNRDVKPAEQLKKYRECVQKEKIEKVLAVKERAQLRELILKIKNALGFFLTEEVLLLYPVLDDYCQNTESRKLEGKQRFTVITGLLTINPRTIDRSIDILNEEEEAEYEEQIYAYDDFVVKCYKIPHIEPAGYKEDKLLQVLHTTIDLEELMADKSYLAQKEEGEENYNYCKTLAIILSTYITFYTHVEAQIRKNRLDLAKEINYNIKDLKKLDADVAQKKKDVKEPQSEYDKLKNRSDKTSANAAKGKQQLENNKALLEGNAQKIAKIGNGDPAIRIERCQKDLNLLLQDGENKGSYHANLLSKEIDELKKKKAQLAELEKEKAQLEKAERKNNEYVSRKEKGVADLEPSLGKKKTTLDSINSDIESLREDINTKELHHQNLLERRRTLMQRKFSSLTIKFSDRLGKCTNHGGFKTLNFILSFNSFINSIDSFAEDTRSTVSAVGTLSDLVSVTADLSLCAKGFIKKMPGSLKTKVSVRSAFVRGATSVSCWFGIVGTLSSAVVSFMDAAASSRKGDNASMGLNLASGIIGVISSACMVFVLTTQATSIILLSIGVWGMVAMFIITILIMAFCDDDFQTFLRATVFSSNLPLQEINICSPYQVRYKLCNNKTAYGKNDCIYEETYNSGFRVNGGQADPMKRSIDLKVFKNMVDFIYNLMVGFGVQAIIRKKDLVVNKKGNQVNIYNPIEFLLFFNGYDYETSEIDLELDVFTVGIKEYLTKPKNDYAQQKYTFISIPFKNPFYGNIRSSIYKDRILGGGIEHKFRIADEIKNHLEKVSELKINSRKICYVLFFRFKMNNGVWWPFNKDNSENSTYVAISETIQREDMYGYESHYSSRKSNTHRHTISDKGVYIGTKEEILVYLKTLEKE